MIKNIIIAIIVLGLGGLFFLQKQHEKKEALELKKRQEEAFKKAHATPSPAASSLKGPTKPTPVLAPAGSAQTQAHSHATQANTHAEAQPSVKLIGAFSRSSYNLITGFEQCVLG